jgi:hypothetical protein
MKIVPLKEPYLMVARVAAQGKIPLKEVAQQRQQRRPEEALDQAGFPLHPAQEVLQEQLPSQAREAA